MSTDAPEPRPEDLLVHAAFLKRVARYLVHDSDTADDVEQEVWVAALRHPPRHIDAARSWLWKVATNVVRLRARRETRAQRRESSVAVSPVAPSIQEIREREAVRTAVLESLLGLDEKYREVLLLRFFEELPWRQVAQRLQVPVETARTRAKRARALLKHDLEEELGHRGHSLAALVPLFELQHAKPLGHGAVSTPFMLTATLAVVAAAIWVGTTVLWTGDLPPAERSEDAKEILEPTAAHVEADGPTLIGAATEDLTRERGATDGVARAWSGRVIDELGVPLAGAEVRVGSVRSHRVEALTHGASSAGADGRFQIPARHRDRPVRLVVRKPGFASYVRVETEPQELGDLVLCATGTFHVVVRDAASDAPVEGAQLERVVRVRDGELVASLWSDAQGRAAITLPRARRNASSTGLRISAPGYAPRLLENLPGRIAEGTGSSTEPREIYLRRATPCRVRVIGEEGAPVEGATVRAWSCRHPSNPVSRGRAFVRLGLASTLPLGTSTTDSEGYATFPMPATGRQLVLTAESSGRAAWVVMARFRPHRSDVIHLSLRATTRFKGLVRAGGTPVPGARVALPISAFIDPVVARTFLRDIPPAPLARWLHVETDDEGRFISAPLPFASHGVHRVVKARHGRYGDARVHVPPDYDGAHDLMIRFGESGRGRVRVVDTRGQPITGASVEVPYRSLSVLTDAQGIAEVPAPADERVHVHVHADAHATESVILDGTQAVFRVAMRRARSLVGRVVDSEGRPARAGLRLHRKTATGKEYVAEVWTGASGRFTFEGVGEGPWILVATEAGCHVSSTHAVQTDARRTELALPPCTSRAAAIQGRLVDGEEMVTSNYSVLLRPLDRAVSPYRPSLAGARFRFDGLPAGVYRLEARFGLRVVRQEMTLLANERRRDVALALPSWALLSGDVARVGGPAPVSVRLRPVQGPSGRHRTVRINRDGRFAFKDLAAGSYRIDLVDRDGMPLWLSHDGVLNLAWGEEVKRTLTPVLAAQLVLEAGEVRPRSGPREAYRRGRPPAPKAGPAGAPGRATTPRGTSLVALICPDGERIELGAVRGGAVPVAEPLREGTYEVVLTTGDVARREYVVLRAGTTTVVKLDVP